MESFGMGTLFRWIPVICFILIAFHALFLFLNYQSKRSEEEDIHSLTKELEHHARLNHLNSTLTLLNEDLKSIKKRLRQHILDKHDELQTKLEDNHAQIAKETQLLSQSTVSMQLGSIKKVYRKRRAVLFTMDSISSYEHAARQGGAAGEIIIRRSLEDAFQYFNIDLRLIRSDDEFESSDLSKYDIIILDQWTWAARGWVPKSPIRGKDDRIFIMDFFGSQRLRGTGLNVPPSRFLTAFGSPWNPFLGYYIKNSERPLVEKLAQGIIWGKDLKHFDGKHDLIHTASKIAPLIATVHSGGSSYGDVRWIGHQSPKQWSTLLAQSRFLLGLGNPLLGPSAIDAIAHGCMYINPIYNTPMREVFTSQHPFAAERIGDPYVCSYHESNMDELKVCLNKAMSTDLKPYIPKEFERDEYFDRVRRIFELE